MSGSTQDVSPPGPLPGLSGPVTQAAGTATDNDLKKCWICFADETEDTALTSAWKSPCPCALVAHEACLLDWIADLEDNERKSAEPSRLQCPQCKADIALRRPHDLIVTLVQAVNRVAAQVVTPIAATVLSSAIWHAFALHGTHSILIVFGQSHASRILAPFLNFQLTTAQLHDIPHYLRLHWRLYCGVCLITPTLLLSRTRLIDPLLPLLPLAFFATQDPTTQNAQFLSWPPSAAFAFAMLPYVRGLYNAYFDRYWAAKEKQWLKALQPRAPPPQTDVDEPDNGQEGQPPHDQGHEAVFELRLDANILPNWPDGQPQPAQNIDLRDNQQDHPAPAEPIPAEQHALHRDQRISFTTAGLAQKFLGALLFPAAAALAGDLLRFTLPATWTQAPAYSTILRTPRRPSGLLQEKWGRSLVGGCSLVLLKDAIALYVKWRMVEQHRQRQVLDYNGKRVR